MKDCYGKLHPCFTTREIESEINKTIDDVRLFLESATQMLKVELPDLKPCFGLTSDQTKLIPTLAFTLSIVAARMVIL